MINTKIKVKDIQEFVKTEYHLYASMKGKRFFIAIHAGPNVKRYLVEKDEVKESFSKLGDAVRFFNAS